MELLTVMIVVAILSSAAIIHFLRGAERARCVEAISALDTIRGAQLRYYTQYADFANNLAALDLDDFSAKFFNDSVPMGEGEVYAPELVIGGIQRNNVAYRGANPYTLEISIEGTITCTDGVGENTCSKIGF